MNDGNMFLTLTYDDDHLESPRLIYPHFQKFMADLRERINRPLLTKEEKDEKKISVMVTGEYGELTKRPHWHALIFNYWPSDTKPLYKTERDEQVYRSDFIQNLWSKGNTEYGTVTIDSAGYVARYAAKKLVHGLDQEHDYHPIHKTSSKNAIGKRWIEKYHKHCFENGFITLPNGALSKIPRYYVDWAKKNKPKLHEHYVTEVLPNIIESTERKIRKEEMEYFSQLWSRSLHDPNPVTRPKVKETILKLKFKRLQERLKL